MLQFLKDSTFKANDVFFRATAILKRHYFSIAGLCFIMFVTSNLSTSLAVYAETISYFWRVILFMAFVGLFFSLQLILIKRAIELVKDKGHLGFWHYIPSLKQFIHYVMGLLLYTAILSVVSLLSYVLCFPLIYSGIGIERVQYEIFPLVTGAFMFFVLLRISFFPFFILDHDFNTYKSYTFSVALTRGNVMKLVLIVFIVASTHILQIVAEYFGYSIIASILSGINSFVIIPLVSVVMAIAYLDMVQDYKGGDNPALLKNII